MQELRSSALAAQAITPLVRTCQAKPTRQTTFYLVSKTDFPLKCERYEINKTDKQDNFPPAHIKVGASGF
jgi:hypothetical protein